MHRLAVLGANTVATLALCGSATAWSWPADGEVLRGFSLGADTYAGGHHRGIDVAGADGSPVRAPASGTVSFAGSLPTHGRGVTILTADGYAVTLVHLGAIGVEKGATVDEGDSVATMGSSGTPEHGVPAVHLGIRRADDDQGYVDPLGLLPVRSAPPPPAAAPSAAPVTAPAAQPVTAAPPVPPAPPGAATAPGPPPVASPSSPASQTASSAPATVTHTHPVTDVPAAPSGPAEAAGGAARAAPAAASPSHPTPQTMLPSPAAAIVPHRAPGSVADARPRPLAARPVNTVDRRSVSSEGRPAPAAHASGPDRAAATTVGSSTVADRTGGALVPEVVRLEGGGPRAQLGRRADGATDAASSGVAFADPGSGRRSGREVRRSDTSAPGPSGPSALPAGAVGRRAARVVRRALGGERGRRPTAVCRCSRRSPSVGASRSRGR